MPTRRNPGQLVASDALAMGKRSVFQTAAEGAAGEVKILWKTSGPTVSIFFVLKEPKNFVRPGSFDCPKYGGVVLLQLQIKLDKNRSEVVWFCGGASKCGVKDENGKYHWSKCVHPHRPKPD